MSLNAALQHLTRQRDDPESGWLTPDRIRAALVQVYDDIERATAEVAPLVEERVVVAPPVGRSSHVSLLPQIVPEDGWVPVEHGMNSEDVIVQASAHGLVVPLGVRVLGPNTVSVHADTPVNQPTKIVVIR